MRQQEYFSKKITNVLSKNTLSQVLLIVALSVLSSIQTYPAFAGYDKGQAFGPAFAENFNDLMNGLRQKKCIGQISGQSLDITFAGLLPHNIHLSESQRHDINSVAQEGIRKRYGQIYNISYSQEIGTTAGFNYNNPEELAKTAKHHMKDAPFFLLIQTRRPYLDIIQLEVILFARTQGASLCNRQKTLYLHLPSNTIISLHHLGRKERGVQGEYIDNSQGYLFGIRKIMQDFKGIKLLPFLPGFDDKAKCGWHNRETRLFQSQYFALQRRPSTDLNYRHGEWPKFQKLPAQYGSQSDSLPDPAPDSLLTLHWAPVEKNDRVIQFTLSLYDKTGLKNTVSYFIVADNARYKACLAPKKIVKKKEQKLQLTINTFKRHYRIGDKLRFTVSANKACELNIVYRQADGEMILLPYYHNEKPLVGGYFLKAGETRIIPVHPDLNMDITGPIGTERLFIQCKVGGLGESRIDQATLDRLKQGKTGKAKASVAHKNPSGKNQYAGKAIEFFVAQ